MAEIRLTINGKEVVGEKGDTVLEVCEKNGIYVPTLCHHKCLLDTGACRMCLAEIEGMRGYNPSCVTKANDGMVVRTDTEELDRFRRMMLELLFSQRNHYCMFCESSGDCELQNLAYKYKINYNEYKSAFPRLRMDSTQRYFVYDENRCILCQRCNRACSEVAGHNVLGLGKRAIETTIVADLNSDLGNSTCTSCGTCVQVCPTGALIDRRSAYLGRMYQCETTKSTCSVCSIGCGVEIVTRDNHILKINGDWGAEVNKGILCKAGRYLPLHEQKERLTKPMIKRNGAFSEISWDEALDYAAKKFREVGMENVAGMISPRATNEEANLFAGLLSNGKIQELGPDTVLADGFARGRNAKLSDIRDSDCILIYRIDLDKETPVAGSFAKLAFYQHEAKIILADDKENSFGRLAMLKLASSEINQAKESLDQAANPVIIYGTSATTQEVEKLAKLCEKVKLMGLLAGGNSKGLRALGINGKANVQNAKAFYILACDDDLAGKFDRCGADFVVLQTSYFTTEVEKADMVLPSPLWSEKEGSITNVDGITQRVAKAIDAPDGMQSNEATIRILNEKISR